MLRYSFVKTYPIVSTISLWVAVLCIAQTAHARIDIPVPVEPSRAGVEAPPVVSGPLKRSDTPLSPRTSSSAKGWRQPFEKLFSNRILWTYAGPTIIREVAGQHIQVQCALDFWVPENNPETERMVCTNPHGGYAGFASDALLGQGGLRRPDINSEEWRAFQLQRAKQLVDAGCTSFQQDVPWLNFHLVKNNGCYSDGSVEKFRAFLRENLTRDQLTSLGVKRIQALDYRNDNLPTLRSIFTRFQMESTRQYHRWLHDSIRRYAQSRHARSSISFSGNFRPSDLKDGASSWLAPYFDFAVAEAYGDRKNMVGLLRNLARSVRTFRGTSAVTFPTSDVWLNQRSVATAYALGLVAIAPWDVFLRSGAPRYYGDPSDYASIFRMIRLNPEVFDNYEAESDSYLTYDVVAPAQGYVVAVDTPLSGPRLIRLQGINLQELSGDKTVAIGNTRYEVPRAPKPDVMELPRSTDVAMGQALWIEGAPEYIVTVRKHLNEPQRKTVHAVNWGNADARYLVLRRTDFPLPPASIITPESPRPKPIYPFAVSGYLVYPIPSANWTILF